MDWFQTFRNRYDPVHSCHIHHANVKYLERFEFLLWMYPAAAFNLLIAFPIRLQSNSENLGKGCFRRRRCCLSANSPQLQSCPIFMHIKQLTATRGWLWILMGLWIFNPGSSLDMVVYDVSSPLPVRRMYLLSSLIYRQRETSAADLRNRFHLNDSLDLHLHHYRLIGF